MKCKKMSKKSIKKKLWKLFSLYVRLKECNKDGIGICVTCNARLPYQQLQAGHFIDGRGNSILFDQRGVHSQCARCNIFLHGNKIAYWKYMEYEYGRNTIDDLIKISKQPKHFTKEELNKMMIDYTLKCSRLMKKFDKT